MERKVTRPSRICDMVIGERMAVLGTVVEKDKAGFFIIDDGTGKATVLAPSDSMLDKLEVGSLVRVIGLVIESSEIKSEIIQNMKGLDVNIYSKYLDLHNKFKPKDA
jgi:hypothetical protein